MRRPEAGATLILLGACLALAACSRLTFVKPDPARGDYDRVAPEYSVREDPGAAQHAQALRQAMLAEEALRGGRLEEAGRAAEAALDLDPGSSEAHTLLAVVAEQRGRADRAGSHYARAVELAPRIVYGAGGAPDAEREAELHHRAHEECYIANSVRTEITVRGVDHAAPRGT